MAGAARALVVDTDVASCCGGPDATYPKSKRCRDFLLTYLTKTGHAVVVTPEIEAEWKLHQSRFFRQWRVAMYARRRVRRAPECHNVNLRRRVGTLEISEKRKGEILKDLHLIEAAAATDRAVCSTDETVHGYLTEHCNVLSECREIEWVNPDLDGERAKQWLLEGAPSERLRKIGYAADLL